MRVGGELNRQKGVTYVLDRGDYGNRDTTAQNQGELQSVIKQNLSGREPDSLQNSILPSSAKDSFHLKASRADSEQYQ